MQDFTVGEWLAQPSLNRLSRGTAYVHVEPKVMDLLALLVARAGEVVSKEEILQEVWARPYVAESVLTRAVAELRRALGDDARCPTHLETITKRGYRVVAPVAYVDRAGASRPGTVEGPPKAGGDVDGGLVLMWGEREIAVPDGEHIVGRGRDAAVRIGSTRLSRHHARITVRGGKVAIEDLGSKNGTFLRGRRVQGRVDLLDGDDICVGGEVLIVRLCLPAGTTVPDTGR